MQRISDNILLGSTLFKKCTGLIVAKTIENQYVCAIGSALASLGYITKDTCTFGTEKAMEIFPILKKKVSYSEVGRAIAEAGLSAKCNVDLFKIKTEVTLFCVIAELNDFCEFSFSQTASVIKILEDNHPEWFHEENIENGGNFVQAEQLEVGLSVSS